ncbi:HTH_48 domain-containing protein [Trichonephila clavipes]|nr:HTH_48 domain-containing protein [Trichonephila clavipes]
MPLNRKENTTLAMPRIKDLSSFGIEDCFYSPDAQKETPIQRLFGSPYEDRMAFTLQNTTIEEQRSVIQFLTAEGENPAAIHRWMVTVYGEKCVCDKSIRKWSARFRAGCESVGDDQRTGQANTVLTSDLIDKNPVDNCSRQVAISDSVCRLGSEAAHRPAKGTAYGTSTATSISVSGRPRFHETDRHSREVSRQGVAHCLFRRSRPATCGIPRAQKSINSDVYCETLRSLRRSIKNKRPELLTEGVVVIHDNARPHVSRVTQMELDKFKWETLDDPSYSQDMSLCDFHAFGSLKKHLKGESALLRRRTQGHREGLGLVTVSGNLGKRILRLVHQ